jgi:hypothetical protein
MSEHAKGVSNDAGATPPAFAIPVERAADEAILGVLNKHQTVPQDIRRLYYARLNPR